MEVTQSVPENKLTKTFISPSNPKKMLISVILVAVGLGVLTGYILSNKQSGGGGTDLTGAGLLGPAKNPEADSKTFRDFAEGTVRAKPQSSSGVSDYSEGTHVLERAGAIPVALTSSVVDLSQYEGKKVKVFGETQKALKEGWLMDVGKVEEIK